jgi:cysteine synthase A
MKIANNITELIGNTPLVKLTSISKQASATVLGKCEFLNPTHSVKDRIGNSMIQEAIKSGKIVQTTKIIEPTSGNTGIALAGVCASLGLELTLVMPSSMSIERRRLLSALGANLVLTNPELGMKGAVERAVKIYQKDPSNSYIPQQFENLANSRIHELTTAKEILNDTDGKIDIFIASVGTGGTITGIGKILKEHNPNIQIIAVEPTDSAVLSGGDAGPHKIQGIGAGFVPKILDTKIYDEVVTVSNDDAINSAREIAKNEGLIVGISSGANCFATKQIAIRSENKNKVIVTILCDTGERYFSSGLYDEEL